MKIENILNNLANAQKFSAPDDELTKMISQYDDEDDELSLDELEFVCAAGNNHYQTFLNKAAQKKR